MAVYASIDIASMATLCSAADIAVGDLPFDAYGYRSILSPVDVDSAPSVGITKASTWLEAQIPGLKRRLALAQAIEAQKLGRQFVVQIDETQLSTVPPSQATANGKALAQKLRDSNGTVDPAVLAELTKNQNDPYFAAGFAGELTPAQLAQAVNLASLQGKQKGAPGTDAYQAWFKQYQGLLSAMGTTVATATRNTGTLALPPGYADEWTKAFEAKPGDDGFRYGQAMSLGYLLHFGAYSTQFLDTVSTDVYNFERGQDGKVWGPRAGATTDWPVDPTGNGLQSNVDVLSGIMAALSNNPVAAQTFFDVGNPNAKTTTVTLNGHKVQVNDRLKYLLIDRTWSSQNSSDEGAGLGAALDAASTYFRDGGSTGQVSAQLASQTIALLGNQIGSGGDNLGFGHTWNIYTKLRPSVARIVASYMPDLYRVIGPDGDPKADPLGGGWTVFGDSANPGFPPGMPYGAQLDPSLTQKVLQTLGEDPSNIQIVTAGAAATQNQLMNYVLQKSLSDNGNAPTMVITGQNVPLVQNSAILGSAVLGYLVNQAYTGDSDKEAADKKRAALISKTLSMAASIPGLPSPTGAWSSFAFDQVKDYAIDKIGEGPDGDSSAVYGQMDAASKTALTQSTLNQMLRAGYLDPKYYAEANKKAGGDTYQKPPPEALTGHTAADGVTWVPDDPPSFAFGSAAYRSWARTGSPRSWLGTNVLDPYNNAYPNIK